MASSLSPNTSTSASSASASPLHVESGDPYLIAPPDSEMEEFNNSAVRLVSSPENYTISESHGHVSSPPQASASTSTQNSYAVDAASPTRFESPPSINTIGQIPEGRFHDNFNDANYVSPLVTHLTHDNLNIHSAGYYPTMESRITAVPVISVSQGDCTEPDHNVGLSQGLYTGSHLSPRFSADNPYGASSMIAEPSMMDNVSAPETSSDTVTREEDGSWFPHSETGQAGLGPNSRGDVYVESPNEMEQNRRQEEKKSDISAWSFRVSVANGEDEVPPPTRSGGDVPDNNTHSPDFSTHNIAQGDGGPIEDGNSHSPFPDYQSPDVKDEDEEVSMGFPHSLSREPSPRQITKPQTSNEAMTEFERLARGLDALSITATRDTDPETRSIANSISMRNVAAAGEHGRFDRRTSFQQLINLRPAKRRLSNLFPMGQPNSDNVSSTKDKDDDNNNDNRERRDSRPISLQIPFGRGIKQRTRSLSSQGAFVLAGTKMAAVGGGKDPFQPTGLDTPMGKDNVETRPHRRSTGALPGRSTPRLRDLIAKQGGLPVPIIPGHNLEPPRQRSVSRSSRQTNDTRNNTGSDIGNDGSDDDNRSNMKIDEERGQTPMSFGYGLGSSTMAMTESLPVPTMEGFRAQITELNPRLQPNLIDRFAKEQVDRYRTLVSLRASHSRTANNMRCPSDGFCVKQGGKPDLLQARTSAQGFKASAHPVFFVISGNEPEIKNSNSNEGFIQAQFPPGVPSPPVKRLPAKFECPICFKVVEFQKPSDWTKHVFGGKYLISYHPKLSRRKGSLEVGRSMANQVICRDIADTQPFTCTFPECSEPKSFKRKADWVRHETERHRQLERWVCTMANCNHVCYRRSNFVQHLHKEHGVKGELETTERGSSDNMDADGRGETSIAMRMADNCRERTTKYPQDEPCRFCGYVFHSWKHLQAHLAQHLEQIALPVIRLLGHDDQVQIQNDPVVRLNQSPPPIQQQQQQQQATELSTLPVPSPWPQIDNSASGATIESPSSCVSVDPTPQMLQYLSSDAPNDHPGLPELLGSESGSGSWSSTFRVPGTNGMHTNVTSVNGNDDGHQRQYGMGIGMGMWTSIPTTTTCNQSEVQTIPVSSGIPINQHALTYPPMRPGIHEPVSVPAIETGAIGCTFDPGPLAFVLPRSRWR